MNKNPLSQGIVSENSAGVGLVTPSMVQERAFELALINGRWAHEFSQNDWEQAQRELTGGVEEDSQATFLESAPESERWDPLPGFTGSQVSAVSNEEGRSESQRLFEQGVQEAEHDQMRQAALDSKKLRK